MVLVQCSNHCSGHGFDREAAVFRGWLPFESARHDGKRLLWLRWWDADMRFGAFSFGKLLLKHCLQVFDCAKQGKRTRSSS